MVAPVSGVLHSGIQLAADRYAYLAGFGFALLAGACLLWIVRQRSRGRVRTWVVGAAGIVATFAIVALGAIRGCRAKSGRTRKRSGAGPSSRMATARSAMGRWATR